MSYLKSTALLAYKSLPMLICFHIAVAKGAAPPKSWVDPDTSHRVIRLTDEPGATSMYFNINAFTPDGNGMIYITPNHDIGLINLTNFKTSLLVKGPVGGGPGAITVGRKTPTIYYFKGAQNNPQYASLWSFNLHTKDTKKIADLPPRAGVFSINADETLGVGSYIVGNGEDYNGRQAGQVATRQTAEEPLNKKEKMAKRFAARLPMVIFTINLQTGHITPLFASTDWIDHLQFSPSDPTLLMYAHQGAWQQVDKLWTIRTDGSHNTHIDPRNMQMQASGHQWWSHDGHTIWYDLHFPFEGSSFVAGYNTQTGDRTWYHYASQEASIHFNSSKDETLFAGDGSAASSANKWLYLFRPSLIQDDHTLGEHLIKPGIFHAERLVNMAHHNYHLEPNVTFTPNGAYVIFRSNMFGPTYIFAVEVKKSP